MNGWEKSKTKRGTGCGVRMEIRVTEKVAFE
jgi:hypothetical protein